MTFTISSPVNDQIASESANPLWQNGSVFPVSFAQQRLWFLQMFDPDSPVYNISTPARFRGNLNVPVLKKALNEIVRRHESLRTTFNVVDGNPMQIIAPHYPLDMPVIDLSCLPQDRREEEV